MMRGGGGRPSTHQRYAAAAPALPPASARTRKACQPPARARYRFALTHLPKRDPSSEHSKVVLDQASRKRNLAQVLAEFLVGLVTIDGLGGLAPDGDAA